MIYTSMHVPNTSQSNPNYSQRRLLGSMNNSKSDISETGFSLNSSVQSSGHFSIATDDSSSLLQMYQIVTTYPNCSVN